MLSKKLYATNLYELNVGFNEINSEGMMNVVRAIAHVNTTLTMNNTLIHNAHNNNTVNNININTTLNANNSVHTKLQILTLSGNTINIDASILIGSILKVPDNYIGVLHLDHTNLGVIGEKNITIGIATNRRCNLKNLTGN